jgi:hypothetical protein
MRIGDLNLCAVVCRLDCNSMVNGLVVCWCDAWPAEPCVNCDVRLINVNVLTVLFIQASLLELLIFVYFVFLLLHFYQLKLR